MKLSEILRAQRAKVQEKLDTLVKAAEERDDKAFTAEESTTIDTHLDELRQLDERIGEAEAREAAEARTAEARKAAGEGDEKRQGGAQVKDAPVYIASGLNGQSYFRDLAKRALNTMDAPAAIERLQRNHRMVQDEQRALGNTNTTGGSGGEFAPPKWLIDEYINIARPGRVTADLYHHEMVPFGQSSINIPKLTTGTSAGLQSSQNTSLSQTDLASSYVSTGFSTVGGTQVASQQLLDQAGLAFDRVILTDLAAAYAMDIGNEVINGAGTGANNNSVVNGLMSASVPAGNQITFTSASPTPQQFYGVAANAYSNFVTSRYAPPECWVMHPRRWFWLLSKSDSQGRPLVVPSSVAQNPMTTLDGAPVDNGLAGSLLGLPVYIDVQLPTNLGAGTNQDQVFLLRASDLWLFESDPQVEAFREPYASSVGVLFRIYGYLGTILNRRTTSIATISGTGLVSPQYG